MRSVQRITFFLLAIILSTPFIIAGNALAGQEIITLNSSGLIKALSSTKTGELYLWIQFWMRNPESNSQAQRIVSASQTYGVPIWIDSGNWGSPQLTSSFINYFHRSGVKVVCRLWSGATVGNLVPLNTILHTMDLSGHSRGSVDYQLSIGPEIDAFMIDECDPYNKAYYKAIADYVHSKGKLLFVNPGGPNIRDTYTYADKVSVEYCWWGLINDPAKTSIIANNPQKFIGVSKDYGYCMDSIWDPYIAPRYASYDRPAWYSPMTLQRAIWDVRTGWNGGVYCMQASPDEYGLLPFWWEQYVATLSS